MMELHLCSQVHPLPQALGKDALVDHVDEAVPVTRSALQLVRHRLVPGPPLAPLDVFVGWRHLDTTEALGTEDLDTLVSDGIPGPLEQMDDGLLLVLAVGLSVVISSGNS